MMQKVFILLMLLATVALSACKNIDSAEPAGKQKSKGQDIGNVTVKSNLVYSIRSIQPGIEYSSSRRKAEEAHASKVDLKLDLALPHKNNNQALPLLVFVHGGAFAFGSKEDLHREALSYAKRGYAVASVDYRLKSKAHREPSELHSNVPQGVVNAIEDVSNAIRYLKSISKKNNIDKNRICVVGKSAGGFIALFNGVEPDSDGLVNDYQGISASVSCVVSTGAILTEELTQLATFDSDDANIMIMHTTTIDPVTGNSWEQVLHNEQLLKESGIKAVLTPQKPDSHVASIHLHGPYGEKILRFIKASLGN